MPTNGGITVQGLVLEAGAEQGAAPPCLGFALAAGLLSWWAVGSLVSLVLA